jgi:hypothetical protein
MTRYGSNFRLVAGAPKRKWRQDSGWVLPWKRKEVTIRTLSRYELLEEIGRATWGSYTGRATP